MKVNVKLREISIWNNKIRGVSHSIILHIKGFETLFPRKKDGQALSNCKYAGIDPLLRKNALISD